MFFARAQIMVSAMFLSACTGSLQGGAANGAGDAGTSPLLDAMADDAPFSSFDARLPDFGHDEGLDIDQGTPDGLAPTADAGTDVSIVWPVNRVTLAGTGMDSGGPVSIVWTQVSGPSVSVIRNETWTSAIATSLRVGSYVFRITVTDNEGMSASDEVAVSVAPDPRTPNNIPAFIDAQTSPVFRSVRNLPPLSVGAFVSSAFNVRLAEKYRYALHIGDMSDYYADSARDYSGRMMQFVDLAASNPETYALSIYLLGYNGFYDCDRHDRIRAAHPDIAMHHTDGSLWDDGLDPGCYEYNPTASPDSWIAFANDTGTPQNLETINDVVEAHGAHISVINDIGEWGMMYPTIGEAHWEDMNWRMWMRSSAFWEDASVRAAWGEMPDPGDWGEPVIERAYEGYSLGKAVCQGAISQLMVSKTHPGVLYTQYGGGPATHTGRFNEWRQVAYDHATLRAHHVNHPDDVYSAQMYFGDNHEGGLGVNWNSSNSQSIGSGDELGRAGDHFTHALSAASNAIAAGSPYGYVWVSAKGLHAASYASAEELTGFLKTYYALSMIGGPYFSLDLQADVGSGRTEPSYVMTTMPPYIPSMIALGEVHALFSHLEEYIFDGQVLVNAHGDTHRFTHWIETPFALYEQYAYPVGAEFRGPHDTSPTIDSSVRVVIRKRNGADDWLVAGWVAEGSDREVDVELPAPLGRTTLHFRRAGSVYRLSRSGSTTTATLVDLDAMRPTDHMLDTD